MLDDLDHLRTNPHLLTLLTHYADLGKENRETWQNRLMMMEGLEASAISRLHGELIAFSWAEQNTGQASCCYRITLAGQRALRQLQEPENEEEVAKAA